MQSPSKITPLIDTHCHLDLCATTASELKNTLSTALSSSVNKIIIPGLHPAQWTKIDHLTQSHRNSLWAAVGLHPWWIEKNSMVSGNYTEDLEKTLNRAITANTIAIGECGLDKVINTPLSIQQLVFETHLRVSKIRQLPLIIHTRKTNQQLLELLKHYQPPVGGVIHAFSGSYDLASAFWSKGFYLGIGGTITYPRAKKTRDAVKRMPLDAIVLETDAPDMPVFGFQGQPNTPSHLPLIAQALAELKSESLETICTQTTANAQKCFDLP
jgi:TatD DNase family protein